jgi:hypothetical protein
MFTRCMENRCFGRKCMHSRFLHRAHIECIGSKRQTPALYALYVRSMENGSGDIAFNSSDACSVQLRIFDPRIPSPGDSLEE